MFLARIADGKRAAAWGEGRKAAKSPNWVGPWALVEQLKCPTHKKIGAINRKELHNTEMFLATLSFS